MRTFKKQFIWALDQAKLAGINLALFLLRSDFSNDRTISLLGHSLGTVIIMHCLNTLYHFYKCGKLHVARIINDIFLWGGAAVLNPTGKLEETMHVFNNILFYARIIVGLVFLKYFLIFVLNINSQICAARHGSSFFIVSCFPCFGFPRL